LGFVRVIPVFPSAIYNVMLTTRFFPIHSHFFKQKTRRLSCNSGAAAGATAEEAKPEEKEEEEEADLGGGMDMFGGGDAGGGDY